MQPWAHVGEILSAVAARLGAGGDVSPSTSGGVGEWATALTAFASILALFAVGGAAAQVANRLVRRSTPELLVLLDQSAAFFARWPEDQLARAPRGELMAEASRCRRIVELLESRNAADAGPAACRPIDGLREWIALLCKRIDAQSDTPSGAAYA